MHQAKAFADLIADYLFTLDFFALSKRQWYRFASNNCTLYYVHGVYQQSKYLKPKSIIRSYNGVGIPQDLTIILKAWPPPQHQPAIVRVAVKNKEQLLQMVTDLYKNTENIEMSVLSLY